MIISHRLKVIYIAVPKTASTSFQVALAKYCGEDDIIDYATLRHLSLLGFSFPRNDIDPQSEKPKFARHGSASKIKSLISADIWNNYLKVSTIRCPYDRLISAYFYTRFFEGWERFNFPCMISHKYIVRDCISDTSIIHINGKIVTDFLMRYEQLDKDIGKLEEKINCPGLLKTFQELKINTKQRPSQRTSSYEMYAKYPQAKLIIDAACYETMDKYEFTRKYWLDYKAKLEADIRSNNSASVGVPRYFFLTLIRLRILRYIYRILKPTKRIMPRRINVFLRDYPYKWLCSITSPWLKN